MLSRPERQLGKVSSMRTLAVVDGTNLINDVGRALTIDPRIAKPRDVRQAYYEKWFDVDRLVQATLGFERQIDPFS